MPGPAVVVVKEGPLAGTRVEVESELVIGRENAGLTIADEEVSRRHAALRLGDGLEIEDLDSLNGTFVNGSRIEFVTALASGDTIRIGKSTMEVESAAAATGGRTVLSAPASEPKATVHQARPAEKPSPAPEPARAAPAPAAATPAAAPPAAAFAPGSRPRHRGVATRRLTPTMLSFGVIAATAAALVLYFALN